MIKGCLNQLLSNEWDNVKVMGTIENVSLPKLNSSKTKKAVEQNLKVQTNKKALAKRLRNLR